MSWTLIKETQKFDFTQYPGLHEPQTVIEQAGEICAWDRPGKHTLSSSVLLLDTNGDKKIDHLLEFKAAFQTVGVFCPQKDYHYYRVRSLPSDPQGNMCFKGEFWSFKEAVQTVTYFPQNVAAFKVYAGDFEPSRPGEELMISARNAVTGKTLYRVYAWQDEKVSCPPLPIPNIPGLDIKPAPEPKTPSKPKKRLSPPHKPLSPARPRPKKLA